MTSSESDPARRNDVEIGSILGDRYRVDSLIDEGAMGRVYLGEHVHMRKRVAIKLLRKELTQVPEVLARFEREALAAAHIEHPNIASATDFGKLSDGSVYLVLEYVEGRTLRRELKRGPFDLAPALRIGRQIASALAAAHELDIVHRDLKPENIMLVERGADRNFVKVLDFGVAKVPIDMTPADPESKRHSSDSVITRAGMVFGTPDYMAPEQALGQDVDHRADLYSLGVILYELLAGVRPFRSDHELGVLGQQLSDQIPSIKVRAPLVEVPEEVERTLFQLLAKEASKRPASASEVVATLEQHLLDLGEVVDLAASFRERFPSASGNRGSVPDREPLAGTVRVPVLASPPEWAFAERIGERVRSVLPKPMHAVPTWGVVAAPVAALVLFATMLIVLSRKGSVEPTPGEIENMTADNAANAASAVTEPIGSLTREQMEGAVKAGELAVSALVERFPDQALAHLAQARMYRKANQPEKALAAVKRALELEPPLSSDRYVASVLWFTAQKKETQAATFRLLKTKMKAAGADIAYDLATNKKVNAEVSRQARNWMKTRHYERVSSKEAAVAAALYLAPSCKVRSALVKRAQNAGDHRSVELLRKFTKGEGCSPREKGTCNDCLKLAQVELAIAEIENRVGQRDSSETVAPDATD